MKYVHITLQVRNLEKSLAFYQGLLGLPITRRSPGERGPVFLGAPDGPSIELIGGAQDPSFAGFSIGFEVENLEEGTKKLEAAGFPKLRGPISPGPQVEFSFFRGPDGEEIQLLGHH